jgi:uncharacterized CHY-type Zn-finger protein
MTQRFPGDKVVCHVCRLPAIYDELQDILDCPYCDRVFPGEMTRRLEAERERHRESIARRQRPD